MTCSIDDRISSSSFMIGDWPLSRLFLKNNADYPWVILVPRVENAQEVCQLSMSHQHQLMEEISHLSSIMRHKFQPDKLNIAALGNIVSQLHIHIVARFQKDMLWPHGIWQEALTATPYEDDKGRDLLAELQMACAGLSIKL